MQILIILAIAFILSQLVLHSSAKENERKFWEREAANPNPSEHGIVDNQASGGAWALSILILIVALFVAMPH